MRTYRHVLGPLTLALVLTIAGAVLAPPVHAEESANTEDVVVLTDGRTITGRIVGEDESFVSIRAGGVLRAYPRGRIESVTHAEIPSEPSGSGDGAGEESGSATETADAPPAGDTPEAAKQAQKAARKAKRAARDSAPPPLSAEARSWLREVLNRLRSPAADDPSVRASLAAALRSLGPAAVPAIRAAAAEADDEIAQVLQRTATALEQARRGRTTDTRAAGADAKKTRARGDLVSQLGLTREQGKEARLILKQHMKARREIARAARADGTAREEVVEQIAALRTQTRESLRAILDAEQAARFDELAPELMRRLDNERARAKDGKKRKKKSAEPDPAVQ